MSMHEATLDHVLIFPPDLSVNTGRAQWLEDCRYDHAVRVVVFNGNDAGFPFSPDATKMPFKHQIQRRDWASEKNNVTAAMHALGPLPTFLAAM